MPSVTRGLRFLGKPRLIQMDAGGEWDLCADWFIFAPIGRLVYRIAVPRGGFASLDLGATEWTGAWDLQSQESGWTLCSMATHHGDSILPERHAGQQWLFCLPNGVRKQSCRQFRMGR